MLVVCVCFVCKYGNQRLIWEGCLVPCTLWIMRIEFLLWCLVASTTAHWATLLVLTLSYNSLCKVWCTYKNPHAHTVMSTDLCTGNCNPCQDHHHHLWMLLQALFSHQSSKHSFYRCSSFQQVLQWIAGRYSTVDLTMHPTWSQTPGPTDCISYLCLPQSRALCFLALWSWQSWIPLTVLSVSVTLLFLHSMSFSHSMSFPYSMCFHIVWLFHIVCLFLILCPFWIVCLFHIVCPLCLFMGVFKNVKTLPF